ncbi:unnamed protein product [Dimorphilus gyrociliatus]|uniref:Peptidase metallopeptidase domain-containing protein n=1 Tax=Dimorphilus gyrociliatus TaxID=2664684 RepID=A0A7I8W1Q4_9ANNE|nr:unnamed protein product [Dimorphilus gyrociliatus]
MKAPLLGFIVCAITLVNCSIDYNEAEKFLEKYEGFKIPKLSPNEIQKHPSLQPSFIKALKKMQKYAGIPITGKLDDLTMETMRKPRCGNPDGENEDHENDNKEKRYAVASKWYKTHLTYYIKGSTYTYDLDNKKVEEAVAQAFKYWSDVSALTFERRYSSYNVDIIMYFAKKSHGDSNPFDGPGGVLAHAYFPTNGDVHFDDDEAYTLRSYAGTNLLQIATHEIGHSLGLQHSSIKSAVMAPYYYGYSPNFALQPDDINGIRSLYGSNRPTTPVYTSSTTKTVKSTVKTPVNSYPDPCSLTSIDTFFESKNGFFYVFKGEYYWKLNRYADLQSKIPTKISDGFPGLPNDIDAAFMWFSKSTYFFKGDLYWRFRDGVMQSGFPRRIGKDGFRGVPNNLDSAFVYKGNNVIYFTKGNLYYRYENFRVKDNYPKQFDRIWEGLPAGVDAALAYVNEYNYFFKGSQYYRFNPSTFSVDKGYPKSIAQWWFRCYDSVQDAPSDVRVAEDSDSTERETENDREPINLVENKSLSEIDEEGLLSNAATLKISIIMATSLVVFKLLF